MKSLFNLHRCALVLIFIQATGAYAQDTETLRKTGATVAEQQCSRCHVVRSDDPFSGISSTPSFHILVNGLEDWEDRFQSFHTRLPHPSIIQFRGDEIDENRVMSSIPVILDYDDIDALVEYARGLKKAK